MIRVVCTCVIVHLMLNSTHDVSSMYMYDSTTEILSNTCNASSMYMYDSTRDVE